MQNEKLKKNIIIFSILWLVITIVLVMPVTYTSVNSKVAGTDKISYFSDNIGKAIANPIKVWGNVFSEGYSESLKINMVLFTVVYIAIVVVAIIKNKPKHEFTDIEHGSSDWAEGGEQYKVLSNKKGIILAENNYLPIDKRGNVNVLVVGRFRFW